MDIATKNTPLPKYADCTSKHMEGKAETAGITSAKDQGTLKDVALPKDFANGKA